MDFTEYKNTLEYPSKVNFSITHFYKNGKVVGSLSGAEMRQPVPVACKDAATSETVVDQIGFQACRDAYGLEANRLHEKFIVDLLEDQNVADNAFTRRIFGIAWEHGHSNGLSDVYSAFSDMADLVDLAKVVYGKKK